MKIWHIREDNRLLVRSWNWIRWFLNTTQLWVTVQSNQEQFGAPEQKERLTNEFLKNS